MLQQWPLVEAAIHATFHRDLSDPDTLRATTWRWFWSRVGYLLNERNALSDHFAPEPPSEVPTDL